MALAYSTTASVVGPITMDDRIEALRAALTKIVENPSTSPVAWMTADLALMDDDKASNAQDQAQLDWSDQMAAAGGEVAPW